MRSSADISEPIIETLYCDALVLADEARAMFDISHRSDTDSVEESLTRIALSCEALRTTTRMMHVLAWLLNQRAYFRGEMSEYQLRRHGRLPPQQAPSDPGQLARLDDHVREVVERTQAFYQRIERIDAGWQDRHMTPPGGVQRLHEQLGRAVGVMSELR